MKRSQWLLSLLFLCIAVPTLAADPAPAEPRIDVEVADAPTRAFFAGLAADTHANIIMQPEVTGSITLRLRNVTVPEVLEAVQAAYGYGVRRIGSGYLIQPATLQTRLFQVDYLDLERRGTSRTRVSSGQVTQGGNRQYGNGAGGVGENGEMTDGGIQSSDGARSQETMGTSISTRTQSDFWHDIEAGLRALLGPDPGRNVVVNAQAGVIAVRATPNELREVEDYLQQIQHVVTRQVVLEAKILEVELSSGFQAGINWAAVIGNGDSTYTIGTRAPQGGFTRDLLTQPLSQITQTPGTPVTSLPGTSLGGAFTLALDFTDFSAFIDLLSTQGATRVLSSPRVSTLNNQKAVIKAGTDEFFVTNISSNTVTGTASSTSRNVELTPFFSGIALDVLPQIATDGVVTLHIHPTVSDVTDQVKRLTVGGVTDEVPLAFSQVRESDSVVKARSGQVIVIGGLMRSTRSKSNFGTPGLSKIPLLGNLFKSQQKAERKTELVILLRPLVVDSDDQWNSLVAAPLARAAKLDPSGTVLKP
jgi:MSHA biogenesis protein MshL